MLRLKFSIGAKIASKLFRPRNPPLTKISTGDF
jgi:hypothetical protein